MTFIREEGLQEECVSENAVYLITLPLHILQFLAGTPQQHNANYCGPNNKYLTNNDN